MTAALLCGNLMAVKADSDSQTEVNDVYIDGNGILLTFSDNLTSADGISVFEGDREISVTKAIDQTDKNIISISKENGFDMDKKYTVAVNQDTVKSYNKTVYYTTYYSENYDDVEDNASITDKRGYGDLTGPANNFVDTYDGKKWLRDRGTLKFNAPGLDKLEKYTISFDYTAYGDGSGDNGTSPGTTWVGYNIQSDGSPISNTKSYGLILYADKIDSTNDKVEGGNTYPDVKFALNAYPAQYTVYGQGEEKTVNRIKTLSITGTPQASDFTFRKIDSDCEFYKDGNFVVKNKGPQRTVNDVPQYFTTGNFGLGTPEGRGYLRSVDNVLVTVTKTVDAVALKSYYADENQIKLTFDKDVAGVKTADGVTVKKSDGTIVPITGITAEGNSIYLNTSLNVGTLYELNVDSSLFGGNSVVLNSSFAEKFVVSLAYAENFDGKTRGQGYYYNSIGTTDVFEGKLWVWGYGQIGIGYDKIQNLENYTLSFDYTPYLATNISNWLNYAPYTWIRYNTSTAKTSATGKNDGYGWQMTNSKLIGNENTGNVSAVWSMPYAKAAMETDSSGMLSKITVSQQAEASRLTFAKTGADCSVYKNNSLVINYSPAERHSGEDTKGYFVVRSNESNVYQSIDNVRITTCEKVDSISVQDIYIDKNGIRLEFDKDVSSYDGSGIEVYNGFKENISDVEINGKTITLIPEKEFTADTKYDVVIKKDTMIGNCVINDAYKKTVYFEVIYSENYDNVVSDDRTAVRGYGDILGTANTFIDTLNQKKWIRNNGSLIFAVPGIQDIEDYTISFDYASYLKGDSDSEAMWVGYNVQPNSDGSYSVKSTTNAYAYILYGDSINVTDTKVEGGSKDNITFSDNKWKMPTGTAEYTLDGKRDNIIDNITITKSVEESKLTFRKLGAECDLFRNGEFIANHKAPKRTVDGVEKYLTKGYFGLSCTADRGNLRSVDNVVVTVSKEAADESVRIKSVSAKNQSGEEITAKNIAAATSISGQIEVGNASGERKPFVAIIAAYGADNAVLAVDMLNARSIEAGDSITENYQLDNTSGTSKIKAFIWNDFTTVKPYDKAIEICSADDVESTEINVVALGGSLTEGGDAWREEIKEIVSEIYPDKTVNVYNAGKGGTGSDYGAARFAEDVAAYSPDVITVDFAVNDYEATWPQKNLQYMDSIVQQALALKKKPAVIFLNTPFPTLPDSDLAKEAAKSIKCKTDLADYYGINYINVYDYMLSDYENIKTEKGYESFSDYLIKECGYKAVDGDVHAGYAKYAEAIRADYNANKDGFLTKPNKKNAYTSDAGVNYTYDYIHANSSRLTYKGDYKIYTSSDKVVSNDADVRIPDKHYSYPYFSDGIMQTQSSGTEITFTTKASAINVNHIASLKGAGADVYVDGEKKATITCYSQYGSMNYLSSWITLPSDGKEHVVNIKVNDMTDTNSVFRFGEIIERFN